MWLLRLATILVPFTVHVSGRGEFGCSAFAAGSYWAWVRSWKSTRNARIAYTFSLLSAIPDFRSQAVEIAAIVGSVVPCSVEIYCARGAERKTKD